MSADGQTTQSVELASNRFLGQTVIVTGAGSGIGRATTLELLAAGANVVGTDIDDSRLSNLAAEISNRIDVGGRLATVQGDIADLGTIDAIVGAAAGRIDGLASIAGISDHWLPPAEIDDETWTRVFDVNVTGPMRLTRAVLPVMIEKGRGAIVFVSSEAALRSSISGAAYTSSKHALNGLCKSVAFYYGPLGIRANTVAPGGVNTNIVVEMRSSYAAQRSAEILKHAVGPSVGPKVIARTICWLLAAESEHINGVVLPCDGGWSTF
jgi:NAD(P)-dependent dehydrogenase (short-subunit alcohol dehydrogenase family)